MARTNAYRRGTFIQLRGARRLSAPTQFRENQASPVLSETDRLAILRIVRWSDGAPLHEFLRRVLEIAPEPAYRTRVLTCAPTQDSALVLTAQFEKRRHRVLSQGEMRIHAV